jgi:hypothetical protein
MNVPWDQIGNHILEHIARHGREYGVGGGALFIAIISTMPKTPPASFGEFWTWIRESLQTAVPSARATHVPPVDQNPGSEPPDPIVPATPAQPKQGA